jgi:predicted SAM-dependent methyltransferase
MRSCLRRDPAYGRFPSCARHDSPTIPLSAAGELNFVSLPDALKFVLLLVDDPEKFRREPDLRTFTDTLTRAIAWTRRRQFVRPAGNPVKINVGSGLFVAEGWINIDTSPNAFFAQAPSFLLHYLYPMTGSRHFFSRADYISILKNHTFLFHNAEYGLPFPNESIDYIYSSHFLEHLFREDAFIFLHECFRVLKKNGVLRLCLPDLEHAISLYRIGRKQKALRFFFAERETPYPARHKYLYDFELVKELLGELGFGDIQRCTYREGTVPDLEKLDNRPDETLFVEALK